MELIRRGATGAPVLDVQQRLARLSVAIDPEEVGTWFGPSTEEAVRRFQRDRRLPADGIVGPDTWGQLVEAGWQLGDRGLYLHEPFFRGDDVVVLQRKLNALGFDAWREDGIFGPLVDAAVRRFQRNVGLAPDGIVGVETLDELDRMRPDLALPSRAHVREAAGIGEARRGLRDAVIAIDPGHGPADPGAMGPTGLTEDEACYAVAEALHQALAERGARPVLLRDAAATPTPSERAHHANQLEAVAIVSIHMNDGDPAAAGATAMYFGSDVSHAPSGHALAETLMAHLVQQVGVPDCRTHPMAIAILRETRMPAVQVEPCFITNPREEASLRDPAHLAAMAAAITDGLAEFLTSGV